MEKVEDTHGPLDLNLVAKKNQVLINRKALE